MARIPNATIETFPEELKYVWDRADRDPDSSDGAKLNIFNAMGNNPTILRGYFRAANPLWAASGLDTRTREIAILRCAIVRHSMYEWHQHVRIGRAAGVTGAEMNALRHWHTSDLFSASEKAMLGYLDALAETDHPSTQVYDELSKHFPVATVVGITMLGAFYFMTAKFVGAMEVEPESPFVGWTV